MTKYILPFLLFVSVGLSQDLTAKDFADILQGADRKHVEGSFTDIFSTTSPLDKALKDSLETKLKLGMKRNKISNEGKYDAAKWSAVKIRVGKLNNGYSWAVNIRRFVRTEDGKHEISLAASWPVESGKVGTTADLKEDIDTALDKVFLAYLELKE